MPADDFIMDVRLLHGTTKVGLMWKLIIIVIAIAPAAHAHFLALGLRSLVLAHSALDCGNCFQFLRRVAPPARNRCAFIKI